MKRKGGWRVGHCIARRSQRVARNSDATRDVREGKKNKTQCADTSDCVQLLELCAEIEKLKCDNHGLQAGMETLLHVFYPILFSHHLQTISSAYNRLVVTLCDAINEARDDIQKTCHQCHQADPQGQVTWHSTQPEEKKIQIHQILRTMSLADNPKQPQT